jgi:uncharacterized protein (TIGR00730 family)
MHMPSDGNPVYRPKKLTIDDIREGCIALTNGDEAETRVCVVNEELRQGMDFMVKYPLSVTMFGSARLKPDHVYYQKAERIANRIVRELSYAVASGGGPGIMEAANKGAFEAKGNSLGLTIKLPMEQVTNPYATDSADFYFFFTRKVMLAYSAEAYLFFPGGFGTVDEFSEILTLVQTNKIARVPMILVGEAFWRPLDDWFKAQMEDSNMMISPGDRDLYTITDDEDLILKIIKEAPIRLKD